jgi:DNA-3-methyladenine glycosylase I
MKKSIEYMEKVFMKYKDGKKRCCWTNPKSQAYIEYHDKEWGMPVHDDHKLFEMLILESFQAGLSWECVLNKREAFREAFDGFDVHKVSTYDEKKQAELKQNERIIRNQRKIAAAVTNAQIFLKIQKEYKSFSEYLWQFTDHKVIYETGKTSSELSDKISKDLKTRGMKFVGTTIIYSYLQAVGVIYSHEKDCFLWKEKS